MTLTDVEFIGNSLSGVSGGAIFNVGIATLTRVTLRNNEVAVGFGGAIANGTVMTIIDSTISGNRGAGGGIYNGSNATLTAVNTTISGNIGGGLLNRGTATLLSVTMSANDVGIHNENLFTLGVSATVTNTAVAGNGDADCSDSNPALESIVSAGHNLSSDGACPFSGPGDLTNTDPLLGPLADNGGPTQTHALLPGSPAIDAGHDAACPAADQRGVPRPADGDGDGTAACDIGAYEAAPASPTPTSVPAPTASPSPLTPTQLPPPAPRVLPFTAGPP